VDDLRCILAGLISEPESDVPRLALADWCEEHDLADYAKYLRELDVRLVGVHWCPIHYWDRSRDGYGVICGGPSGRTWIMCDTEAEVRVRLAEVCLDFIWPVAEALGVPS